MIELTGSFFGKGIVVIELFANHSMYQLVSPYEILHKLQISYVT